MRRLALCLSFSLCLPLVAEQGVPSTPTPLTLDPALYADALREVQGLPRAEVTAAPAAVETPAAAEAPAADVVDWQAAMRDAGTELGDVRLFALLLRLNPLEAPSRRAEDYAAALRLHHLMLAGNARACLELAAACRSGRFASGLAFIQSEPLARVMEQRAAAFHLPQEVQPEPTPERVQESAPLQREQSGGASS